MIPDKSSIALFFLQDDGPRDNPSDPEPSPITLHVDSLIIHRRDDGSFSIGGDTHIYFFLSARYFHLHSSADSLRLYNVSY